MDIPPRGSTEDHPEERHGDAAPVAAIPDCARKCNFYAESASANLGIRRGLPLD